MAIERRNGRMRFYESFWEIHDMKRFLEGRKEYFFGRHVMRRFLRKE